MEAFFVKLGLLLLVNLPKSWANGCDGFTILDNEELSCDVKREIVQIHNKYRQQVAKGLIKGQPPASNMREMYWDDELAQGAQEWANQCKFAHNSNAERAVERFGVGQNLAIQYNSGGSRDDESTDFKESIQDWFDEYKLYDFSPIGSVSGVGHYTQVAWADSYLIGCGYIRWETQKEVRARLYVCNYGPGGNYQTQKPYKVGHLKCSNDLEQSATYPGLCSMKVPPKNQCDNSFGAQRRSFSRIPHRSSMQDFVDDQETRTNSELTCVGDECSNKPLRLISKLLGNSTDPKSGKVYNLITINLFQ